MRALTEKQQRFVEAYTGPSEGNATDAARRAGYTHATTQGPRLLENVGVFEAIQAMAEKVRSEAIADMAECKRILTEIARNPKADDKDRIAATDKLLKSGGAYLLRHEHEHNVKGAEVHLYVPDNGRGRE